MKKKHKDAMPGSKRAVRGGEGMKKPPKAPATGAATHGMDKKKKMT